MDTKITVALAAKALKIIDSGSFLLKTPEDTERLELAREQLLEVVLGNGYDLSMETYRATKLKKSHIL